MTYLNLLKKISLVSVGNILNAGFGLIFLTAGARALNIADFGRYALLTTLLVFMSKVVDLGSNSVFVAVTPDTKNKPLLIKNFYTLKILLYILASTLSVIVLIILGFSSTPILVIFLVGLLFYSVNVTLFAVFQSTEMFTHAVLLNTIPAFFKALVGGLILLSVFEPSFLLVFGVFSISMALCAVLYFFIPGEFRVGANFRGGFIPIFKTSLPAGISQLVSQGWPAVSNTILKISKGFSDVGVFYLADKVASVFSLISLSIFTVILPKNARRKKENLPHDLKETGFLALLILITAVGFVGVSGVFVKTVFGEKYAGSLIILDILIVASAFSAIHAFMENYFYIHNRTGTIMHIALIKLVVFIGLALILMPTWSLRGLALSQLLSAVVGLLLITGSTLRLRREGEKA